MTILKTVNFAFRVFLRRPLFKNYYSSFIRYALMKYGLIRDKNILVTCFDGTEMHVNSHVFSSIIHLYVDNIVAGIDCLSGTVIAINDSLIPIDEFAFNGSTAGEALRRGWAYDNNGKYWFKNGVKFKHMYWLIIETFDLGQYSFADVSGRVVVDIGAFVGDSAIYFALKGARKVYAVEPHPGAYAEMLENIKLNNMESKVVPINAALGSKSGRIKIPNVDINTTGGTYHGLSNNGDVEVPMITLNQLINDYGIEPDILKMDCEGCEFDVILNDYKHVRRFNELFFEYHSYAVNGNMVKLISMLKRDFECKSINDDFYKNYFKDYTKDELGMLHCIKSSFK